MNKRTLKRFALLLSSVIFVLLLVLLLEGVTRILKPEINFQDTERSLLRSNAFGETYGWRPNASGICFGNRVFIDEFGFRKIAAPQNYSESWLLLGDSVTFGVGVETQDTFAQLLQDAHPEARVWNTAVIGYDAGNYEDVFNHLMAKAESLPNLKRVFLFFCLNDVDMGQELESALGNRANRWQLTENVLSFLRRNSKLYLLVKSGLSDRSKFYFEQDYRFYADEGKNFRQAMGILAGMNDYLKNRGVEFTVVILPYEYQLRARDEQNRLPQKRLTAYMAETGISYIDAYDYFLRANDETSTNFLFADFGHFSKKGHRTIYNLLSEKLSAPASAASQGAGAKQREQ